MDSQSILDKFRSISSQQSDSNSSPPKKSQENGTSQGKKLESNGGVKRKQENEKAESVAGLSEIDVGITHYVSKLTGFSGIIKHRFSDFHVNEIDPSGNVVELTSFEVPKEVIEDDDIDYSSVFSEEDWKKIDDLLASDSKNQDCVLLDVTEKTKEERTVVHLAIRKKYGSKVISNTKEVDDKKFIDIRKKVKQEARSDWPKTRGDYLHCVLYKVNKDTSELIQLLADKLKTKNNLIGYAGTKDKRGKTTQRMSFKRKTAEAVLGIRVRNVVFGNFSYQKKDIQLGDNKGNRFKIAIRNVNASNDIIDDNLNSLKENGFINYFGLQRFGSNAQVPTYAVGKALLASDWKSAIDLILKPRVNFKGRRELILAQESWMKDRDAAAAVRWIPKFDNSLEAKVLRTLKSQGNTAYLNALLALPRHTMTLYLHAYQSLIWNRVVSKRIDKFGLKPIAGDLVVVGEEIVCENGNQLETEETPTNEEGTETDEKNKSNSASEVKPKVTKKLKVREISEEEVDKISIYDIAYPLPGHDIEYPNNEIKIWYEEILAESNFTQESLNGIHKHFALGGAHRRMIGAASNVTWKIVKHNDLDQDLILSDEDKMKNVQLPPTCDDGEYKSVIVEFSLDSCCYATMALREIMKCDTSTHHQSQLTELFSESVNKKQKT